MTPPPGAQLKCEAIVRRQKRCQKPGRWWGGLNMVLCAEHADNEAKLQAIGLTSMEPLS